jgi:hypothetical protein
MTDKIRPLSEYLDESWEDPHKRKYLKEAVFDYNRRLREENEALIAFIDEYMGVPDGTRLWPMFEHANRVVKRFEKMDQRISQLEEVIEILRNCDPVTIQMPVGGNVPFVPYSKIRRLLEKV